MLELESVDTIDDALALIRTTWEAGDTDRARELLEQFRETYPDVDDARLRDALPAALLEEQDQQ